MQVLKTFTSHASFFSEVLGNVYSKMRVAQGESRDAENRRAVRGCQTPAVSVAQCGSVTQDPVGTPITTYPLFNPSLECLDKPDLDVLSVLVLTTC